MRVTIATSPAKPEQPNEDFAAACPTGVVLLDGAGLSGTTSKCSHGVAWYARHLGGCLLAGLPSFDASLRDILAQGIRDTASLHSDVCELDDPGTPSSTVVMVRATADRLEYLVLADSVLVVSTVDAQPAVVTDGRADEVGRAFRQAMDATPNGTPEHDEALRRYVQTSWEYRNRPGGFWVAAADPSVASEALTGEFPLREVASVALLSDGASRLVDLFGLADWPELVALLDCHGPEEVIRRVREAEDADPRGARWPRAKAHDDTTLAYCTDLRPTSS
jgi:hypothetical protein